jgi:hypothetical protein
MADHGGRAGVPGHAALAQVTARGAAGRRRYCPDHEALLADWIGLALLVVLELAPAGRVAFVLHDMFDLPAVEAPMPMFA